MPPTAFGAALARFGHCFPAFAALVLVLCVPSWLGIDTLRRVTDPLCFVFTILMFCSLAHTATYGDDCRQCRRARGHDPQDRADRAIWSLWIDHKFSARLVFSWSCIGAAVIISAVIVHFTGFTLVRMPVDLVIVASCWSYWRHFLLAPWCAYCDEGDGGGGGGGEHERIPDPDPVGRGVR